MEMVRFWKEVPRVDPGGQGIGFSWAIAVQTRTRVWRSENGRIVFGGMRGLVSGQREKWDRQRSQVGCVFMAFP